MKRMAWSGRIFLPLGLIVMLALAAGCGKKAEKTAPAATKVTDAPVQVAASQTGTVLRRLPVTGSLKALETVELSPKQGGRIVALTAREGDQVTVGQIVATIDTTDLEAQARSARASIAAAQAKLSQADAEYRQQLVATRTGIGSAIATRNSSQAGVRSAQASLKSARAQLSQVQAGSRKQEIAQQEAQVAIAKRNLEKAQSDYDRYAFLFKVGAVSASVLDQYRTTRDVNQEQLTAAQQQLSLLREGPRSQEVEQARQTVGGAEAALRQAEAALRKAEEDVRQTRAASAQNQVRQAEVQAARAAILQEQNSLTVAEQALRDAVVRSPITGRISVRAANPGQVVASGTTILTVVSLKSVYFEPTVPDVEVSRVRRNQDVLVSVDAYPGTTFKGTVTRIYPSGSEASRAFPIRITMTNPGQRLAPEMFARGEVITERRTGATLVPREALVRSGSVSAGNETVRVFTVENNVAKEHTVKLGLASEDGKMIEAQGVPANSQVIVAGQRSLKNGDKVSLMTTPGDAKTTQTAQAN